MKISELVEHQSKWEGIRGINNGHYNIPRIQEELDEASVETDPLKALGELIDVVIITAGGMAKASGQAGISFEQVDEMIKAKLALNDLKYNLRLFEEYDVATAIRLSRHYWNIEHTDEWEVDGDYY